MPREQLPTQEELPLMNTDEQNPQGSSEQEESSDAYVPFTVRAYEAMVTGGAQSYSDRALWSALFKVWKEDKEKGGNPPLAEWDKETRFDIFSDTKKKLRRRFPREVPEEIREAPSENDNTPVVELTPEQEQEHRAYGEQSLRKIEAMFGINPTTSENLEKEKVPEVVQETDTKHPAYIIPVEPLDTKYRDSKSEAYVEPEEERRYP